MFKFIFLVTAGLSAATLSAFAGDVPATGSTSQPQAAPMTMLKPAGETATRAMQSLPFEPTSSLNNNPYEVDCTRHHGQDKVVYYTN